MATNPQRFEVLVGNVGMVYNGADKVEAVTYYNHYVNLSRLKVGRAAGEPVTLLTNGEPEAEYIGTLAEVGE